MYHKGGEGKPKGFGFAGFVMPTNASNKPINEFAPCYGNTYSSRGGPSVNKQGYTTMSAITQGAVNPSMGLQKKRPKDEEEYFEGDEEGTEAAELNHTTGLAYIPAPGSPSYKRPSDSDSEDDPLEAFMAGIEKQVKKETRVAKKQMEDDKGKEKGVRDDIEMEDDEESYYRYMEENPTAGLNSLGGEDSDLDVDYDQEGNPLAPVKSKYIDPLPPLDHSEIKYHSFEKNFYVEHEEITNLTYPEVVDLRKKLGIKVSGASPPKPVTSFGHFQFDEQLLKAIRKMEYTQPTPIQAQGVPIALAGRDIIGIAKTGSGKTAAFLWPMIVHIMDQRELQPKEGPIGLILAPTRELAQQIYSEAKRFGKLYNIRVVCCYGGGSKWEQSQALEEGAEIIVATPGRMIDMIKIKATNFERVTFLVMDEADRMFDMGFEPQVRSICDHVRPDRQTLLFSATFKKKVEKLARDVLTDPVRVVQGDAGEANEDVTQVVLVMSSPQSKLSWLLGKLVEFTSVGSVLVFVTRKENCIELVSNLQKNDFDVGLLHGDMNQMDRNEVITRFKRQEIVVLCATDVAARGLDITHIRTVVNYDVARDIDTHTHRVGRTGRAGEKGTAFTLVVDKDKEFAGHLVRNLEGANQEVPKMLMDLAMQTSWFKKSRFKGGRGKRLGMGGQGLGFRERPGLGTPNTVLLPNAKAAAFVAQINQARSGPGSERLNAMKSVFQSQYKAHFQSASSSSSGSTSTVDERNPQTDERLAAAKASYGSRFVSSSSSNTQSLKAAPEASGDGGEKKKKSRWDN